MIEVPSSKVISIVDSCVDTILNIPLDGQEITFISNVVSLLHYYWHYYDDDCYNMVIYLLCGI